MPLCVVEARTIDVVPIVGRLDLYVNRRGGRSMWIVSVNVIIRPAEGRRRCLQRQRARDLRWKAVGWSFMQDYSNGPNYISAGVAQACGVDG